MREIIRREIICTKDPLTDAIFREDTLFFDIETTGFSPKHSQLYMIGCATREANEIIIHQYLAETMEEEAQLLTAFSKQLQNHTRIISYNGVGFDIPYLCGKSEQFKQPNLFEKATVLDLYKYVTDMKRFLGLANYKQKSLEKFLGIIRNDQFTGGELINVYKDYVKKKDSTLEQTLLLHNYEDVLGMIDLLPVLSYALLLQGHYQIQKTEIYDYCDYHGDARKELVISLKPDYPYPKTHACHINGFHFTFGEKGVKIRIPILIAELKFFFPNPKDYYYLPKEDIAVHKSIATYVDRQYRLQAKASNCYTKKMGMFLPQLQEIYTPSFRKEFADKEFFFEISDAFLNSSEEMRTYISHIIDAFYHPKDLLSI